MKMRVQALAVGAALLFTGVGCAKVQSRAAFKDGNKEYTQENFKRAISLYERAVELDPNMTEAWFYLGSSYQAMYRPGKNTPENNELLDKSVAAYQKSLETNPGETEQHKKVKTNTLGALIAIHSDEPKKNFDVAQQYAQTLVQASPDDAKNLYALANLYEKFDQVDQAEQTYKRVAELNPNDPKACGALAAFYNKPLWEGRSRFDQAIDVLQRCAALAPDDPGGWQKVASFYWDKAYRDPLITDDQKQQYAQKGMEAVDKALQLKPDYFDAVIYKGLLYRVLASVSKDPRQRAQYLDQAQTLQKMGLELRKQQQAEEAAAAGAAASPAPASAQ
jgi:tetratricopeptide (TPR) repeat protein